VRKVALAILLVAALAGGTAMSVVAINPKYTAISVTNPNNPAQVSNKLVREKTPLAVYKQHINALNACNWKGLMQQYPDQYQLRLNDGKVIKGRKAAAATFAGFVKPHAAGGLCGITFTARSMQLTGGTLAVSWVANSPFLAQPYYGADAYITDDGLMVSMVSTFDGNALVYNQYTAKAVTNSLTGEVSDTLVRESTPDAVLAQHLKALNACDWKGLMAQYPDQYELRGGGQSLTSGRVGATGAGKVFEAFGTKGSMCWIHFAEVNRKVVGGTITVTWVATGTNPAQPAGKQTLVPYYGSDAYVTDDGLMVSMVSTFGDFPLQYTAP
jgi:hypothetical protein